jgi:signal transduction histidine kinase
MKLRIASVSFLIGIAATGMAWLSLQPVLVRLVDGLQRVAPAAGPERLLLARVSRLLPLLLGVDLLLSAVIAYAVLYFTVARPLDRMEELVDQLSTLRLEPDVPVDRGGPLLSRLSGALGRLTAALRREQATTRRQLADLQAANAQLTRAQMELVAAERLATVGKLAAGVAHEVGNPLSGILGYLSLAQARARSDPQLVDFLQRIDSEVQRIDQIVRGLLDLGRQRAAAGPEPVSVGAVARSCARLLSKGPDFARVEVAVEVGEGLTVRAESGALAQVLINLLINAAQAMGGEGRIQVRAEAREGALALVVEDGGPGIPEEILPRIFEPFFTTKEAGRGTGLGLAISQHLVAGMGGSLAAENRAGGGARFTVVLPA